MVLWASAGGAPAHTSSANRSLDTTLPASVRSTARRVRCRRHRRVNSSSFLRTSNGPSTRKSKMGNGTEPGRAGPARICSGRRVEAVQQALRTAQVRQRGLGLAQRQRLMARVERQLESAARKRRVMRRLDVGGDDSRTGSAQVEVAGYATVELAEL